MTKGEEKEIERQIHAALDGPSHPLRGDQVEMLLKAIRRRNAMDIPQWSLVVLCVGLLAIVLIAAVSGPTPANLLQVALLIPAVNLILSPLAAFVIVRKTL